MAEAAKQLGVTTRWVFIRIYNSKTAANEAPAPELKKPG